MYATEAKSHSIMKTTIAAYALSDLSRNIFDFSKGWTENQILLALYHAKRQ